MAAALIVLLALLIAWAVTSGGGGKTMDDSRPKGSGPAQSITPGPSGSGPAISQRPGGRDESGDSGGSGDNGSGTDESSGGTGGGNDTGSGPGSGSASGGGSEGQQIPAGSSIPYCSSSALQLTLRTDLNYGPGEKPKFELVAKNTSSLSCKADLGPKSAVLTITEAGGDDDEVWSSKDCPRNAGRVLLKVPAGETVVHTVEWDRRKSSPNCATLPAGNAGPGTYLVEAKAPGEPVQRASFVLAKD